MAQVGFDPDVLVTITSNHRKKKNSLNKLLLKHIFTFLSVWKTFTNIQKLLTISESASGMICTVGGPLNQHNYASRSLYDFSVFAYTHTSEAYTDLSWVVTWHYTLGLTCNTHQHHRGHVFQEILKQRRLVKWEESKQTESRSAH